MLTIYTVPVSIYTAKLRVVLRHKGLDWDELPPPGGYRSEAYRKIVPSGNIPTMIDGDLMLSDSEAIAEYLNEKHPEPAMLPDTISLRAKARERGRFHDTRLEPALRALYPLIKAVPHDRSAIDAGGGAVSGHLAALDLLLRTDTLPSGRLWLGDAGFAVTFEWLKALEAAIGLPLIWPDAVLKYDRALNDYPAVTDELAQYRPAIRAYLEG